MFVSQVFDSVPSGVRRDSIKEATTLRRQQNTPTQVVLRILWLVGPNQPACIPGEFLELMCLAAQEPKDNVVEWHLEPILDR